MIRTTTVLLKFFALFVRVTASRVPGSTRRDNTRPTPIMETSLTLTVPKSSTTGEANGHETSALTGYRSASRRSGGTAIFSTPHPSLGGSGGRPTAPQAHPCRPSSRLLNEDILQARSPPYKKTHPPRRSHRHAKPGESACSLLGLKIGR